MNCSLNLMDPLAHSIDQRKQFSISLMVMVLLSELSIGTGKHEEYYELVELGK